MNPRSSNGPFPLVLALAAMSCTETRDLGWTVPHGRLPVDERNPIVLANDGAYDNWQGEYAADHLTIAAIRVYPSCSSA
jgi:hypothetical protein